MTTTVADNWKSKKKVEKKLHHFLFLSRAIFDQFEALDLPTSKPHERITTGLDIFLGQLQLFSSLDF